MQTTNTTGWWTCPGCGVDAELAIGNLSGFREPCPDCGEAMILLVEAGGDGIPHRRARRAAA